MGEHKKKDDLEQRMIQELEQLADAPLGVQLGIGEWMAIIGLMQAAMRHPMVKKTPAGQIGRNFILSFRDNLPAEFVGIKRVIDMGFHQRFDVDDATKDRKCRVCGCTNDKACATPQGPCFWVETDLCSACAPAAKSLIVPGR